MDDNRIQYLSRIIQDLKMDLQNLRLENIDVKTQAKIYKHHADQLEGELILLKQTLEQKGRKK